MSLATMAFGCTDPVCTRMQQMYERWGDSRGDRCSAFHRGLTGPLLLDLEDPRLTLPEGVPYPQHQWQRLLTCTSIDAFRSDTSDDSRCDCGAHLRSVIAYECHVCGAPCCEMCIDDHLMLCDDEDEGDGDDP